MSFIDRAKSTAQGFISQAKKMMEEPDNAVYMWSSLDPKKSCKKCKSLDGKVFSADAKKRLEASGKGAGHACQDCHCVWVKMSGEDAPTPDFE